MRFSVALIFSAGLVAAAPIHLRRAISRRAFTPAAYADFQISSTVAGNAEAEAAAIFLDPFAGVDLATVDDATVDEIERMRKEAEAAEIDLFNPAIEAAASEADADALQVGKIKNKVLKLTAFKAKLQIEIAQLEAEGRDASARVTKLAEDEKKLATNIATDVKSAGAASKDVIGGAASASTGGAAAEEEEVVEEDAAAEEEDVAEDVVEEDATEEVAAETPAASSGSFTAQSYANFQISSTAAGNAEAEAAAIFLDPFVGVDLATVSDEVVDQIEAMRKEAESAETELFNPAIEAAASEADADALQVGKIKNKVLKLTAFKAKLQIEIAQLEAEGGDTSSRVAKLAAEEKKLANNIANDVKSAGAASKSVV